MVWKKILYTLFCICWIGINYSGSQNVSGSKLDSTSATEVIKKVYRKYNATYELTGRNDNPLIITINKSFRIHLQSAYCGSSLYYLCNEAGFDLEIPKSKAPVARNWGLYGETIWSQYNGWKQGVSKTPRTNEIYVLLFNNNGRYHVGVILEFHGGINFITGEGNTSDSSVRTNDYLYYDNTKTNRRDIYLVKKGRQGLFAGKERYNSKGLYKIIRYTVK